MTEILATHAQPPSRDALTVDQVRERAAVVYADVQERGLPALCLAIGIEEVALVRARHGEGSVDDLVDAVAELLRGVPRGGELLAYRAGDGLIALLPETPFARVREVAGHVIAGSRRLVFRVGGASVWVSLGIGVAHSQYGHGVELATLERVAQEGVQVARAGGGGRYVHTELYELFQPGIEPLRPGEASAARTEAAKKPAPKPAPKPAERIEPVSQALEQEAVGELLTGLLDSSDDAKMLRERVFSLAEGWIAQERERASDATGSQYKERISLLERRIAKLLSTLASTEHELARVAQLKAVDPGVASQFRAVEGLAPGDDQYDRKRHLLAQILEANLSLRSQLARTRTAQAG